MQTKSSYRVLKWTMLVGTAASLATACVVTTSGDGGGGGGVGDFSFAGESSSTSGKTATGGNTSGAGTTSGGSGGASTAGTAGTMAMGEAGAAAYVAGLCDADGATPSMEPSCAPAAKDDGQDCKICLKSKCCSDWQTCYGDTPTTACGWGPTADADGQFDCIQHCFTDGAMAAANADDLLTECAGKCALQCDTPDNGNIADATNALITCANDMATCQEACFPFN